MRISSGRRRFKRRGQGNHRRPRACARLGRLSGRYRLARTRWGPAAKNFLIRGTPYNRGVVLRDMLDQGADSVGDPTQCHAVAIDGRAPKFDGGIVTRLDCVPFSVVVNQRRRPLLRRGRGRLAQALCDLGPAGRGAARPGRPIRSSTRNRSSCSCPRCFRPIRPTRSKSWRRSWALPGDKLRETIDAFNAACGEPAPSTRPNSTVWQPPGLTPPKTNWARPITEPPFYGYSLRPGVTFTYLGLKVDETARVHDADRTAGKPLGRRRDHGRLDPRPGLSRRLRHDHRHGLRTHRRTGGRRPCRLI